MSNDVDFILQRLQAIQIKCLFACLQKQSERNNCCLLDQRMFFVSSGVGINRKPITN